MVLGNFLLSLYYTILELNIFEFNPPLMIRGSDCETETRLRVVNLLIEFGH